MTVKIHSKYQNFSNNNFGVLKYVTKDEKYVRIQNEDGEMRLMSRKKYRHNADAIEKKARALIGKKVSIRTSQNTKDWSTDKWFSDINETIFD